MLSGRFRKILGGVFLLCLVSILGAMAEEKPHANQIQKLERQYQNALVESLKRLGEILKKGNYRSSSTRESIQKTMEAVQILTDSENDATAEPLLLDAKRLHKDNLLPELILADLYEKEGKFDKANNAYLTFLKEASFFSALNQDAIGWEARSIFGEYARLKLKAHGIDVPEPKSLKKLPLVGRLKTEKSFGLDLAGIG